MSNKPFRVLSIDGGGMRGLYTASFLESLTDRFHPSSKKDIGKAFDLIVGTSTGGLIATGLVAGIEIDKIIDLYSKEGKQIFTNPMPSGGLKLFIWVLSHISKSANSNEHLIRALEKIFGHETVDGIYKRRQIALCLTSINTVNNVPRVFKTPHNPNKHADNERRLVDICLATSAAPIIFPIALIPNPEREEVRESFVDGGLWANNPTLVGLIEALECSKKSQDIEIVSLGVCSSKEGQPIDEKNFRKGISYWKFGIRSLEISMRAQSEGFNFICNFLANNFKKFGKNIKIYRLKSSTLSSEQEKVIGLDLADKKACDTLISLGSEDGKHVYSQIYNKPDNKELSMLKDIFNDLPDL